jgi:hypothetical protein
MIQSEPLEQKDEPEDPVAVEKVAAIDRQIA